MEARSRCNNTNKNAISILFDKSKSHPHFNFVPLIVIRCKCQDIFSSVQRKENLLLFSALWQTESFKSERPWMKDD